LIAAIFIDSKGNLNLLIDLAKEIIYKKACIEVLVKKEFIEKSYNYLFMKWYESNFGSISNFGLVKIAHNNYKEHRLENLYLPYNK
jgi:hypothetical protein